MIDKLFVTSMAWLLAVPLVLLDSCLRPDLTELPHPHEPPALE